MRRARRGNMQPSLNMMVGPAGVVVTISQHVVFILPLSDAVCLKKPLENVIRKKKRIAKCDLVTDLVTCAYQKSY